MQHETAWVLGEQELGPFEMYFSKALGNCGHNVKYHNIHSLYPEFWKRISAYSHRLPRRFDNSLSSKYVSVVNSRILGKYKQEQPSLVFVYNDCLLTPETISEMRRNGSKVVTLLGDDPGYLLPAKKTFLLSAIGCDSVIVPDTGWIEGLKMLEIKNIIFSPVGTDPEVFFPMKPEADDFRLYSSDAIFIGTGYYLNSWGIKRAEVLSVLSDLNFKLFGDRQWLELLSYFPSLKGNYINKRLGSKDVNIACNCSKVYPVTVNSGVVNGVSTRVFDGIASGILVLAEYKSDIDLLFDKGQIPVFRTKSELRKIAEHFIKHDDERAQLVSAARERILKDYTLDSLVPKILEQI